LRVRDRIERESPRMKGKKKKKKKKKESGHGL
jgi:hypothetical protein